MTTKDQAMDSVLVTGGSGYLGELLYLRIKQLGTSVKNLDLIPPSALQNSADWIKADITQDLPKNGYSFDTVFHAAAAVPLVRDKEAFHQVNALGTKRVIEWSYEMGARRFIYVSSSAVFGRGGAKGGAIKLSTETSPCEDYGNSKLLGEKYVLDFVRAHPDMKACIVRPRTLVGPSRLGIFEILFDWIRRESRIYIIGNGENRLQFLHAEDLIEACIVCAQKEIQGVLNIGARSFQSLKKELSQLCEYAGSSSQLHCIPLVLARPALEVADFMHLIPFGKWHYLTMNIDFYFDGSAEAVLGGWQPRYSNQDALRSAYDWYLKHLESFSQNTALLSQHKRKPDQRWLSVLKKLP